MVKLTLLLVRRPDLSHREFLDYWRDRHAPLLLSLPEFRVRVRRYVQQHPVQELPAGMPGAPCDGMAEVWCDDLETLLGGLASDMYTTTIAADEENFIDRSKTTMMISSEQPIL